MTENISCSVIEKLRSNGINVIDEQDLDQNRNLNKKWADNDKTDIKSGYYNESFGVCYGVSAQIDDKEVIGDIFNRISGVCKSNKKFEVACITIKRYEMVSEFNLKCLICYDIDYKM